MEPVTGASETGDEANASADEQNILEVFEDQIARAMFAFGQGFVMDDLQELGNDE